MRANQQFSEHPFSWRGRFSRLSYLAWMGVFTFLFLVVFIFDFMRLGKVNPEEIHSVNFMYFAFLPTIIFLVLSLYSAFVFIIRRLHDLNQSGWWSVLIFVPVLSFILYLYLMFGKGSENRNKYGLNRETRAWERYLGNIVGLFLVLIMVFAIMMYFVAEDHKSAVDLIKILLGFYV